MTKRNSMAVAGIVIASLAARLDAAEPGGEIVGMSEVVVTATRTEVLLRDTPDIVQIIDSGKIADLNPRHTGELMEYSTGTAVATGTGSGLPNRSAISMNGLPPNYTLVLVDGVRLVSDHIHTGQNVDLVSPFSVERIEIMRGAASAQYGTDAIGGVVNIVTRRAGTKPEGRFRFSTGSHDTHEASLDLRIPAGDRVKFSGFANWEKSDGIPLKLPAARVNNTGYERRQTMGRADVNLGSSTRAYAWLNRVDETMEWRGGETDSYLVTPVVGIDHRLNGDVELAGRLSYTKWKAQLNGELNTFLEPAVHARWRMKPGHTLMAGADALRNEFDRTAVGWHRQDAWGSFLQHEWLPSAKLSMTTAMRQDKVGDVETAWSPKLSVLFSPERRVRFRGSVGRGFHAPSLQELYEEGYGHGGTAYRFGNPLLQPEYSTTWTAGLEWQPAGAVRLALYGFHSELDDMIVPVYRGPWVKNPQVDVWERTNIKTAMVRGAELSARVDLGSMVRLETGGTITENRDETSGRQLPYSPGSSVFGRLSATRKLAGGIGLSGFAGVRAAFDREAWNWQPARGAARDDPNGLTTPLRDFTKIDAGLAVDVAGKYEIFLRAENLLGEDIENLDDAFTVIDGGPVVRMGFAWALPLGR